MIEMPKLKSMAFTKADKKDRAKTEPCTFDGDKYPYGLRISLEERALKKLGLDSLPKVGGTLTLTATVEVVSTSQNERNGGGVDRRLELQITDMDLSKSKDGAVAVVDKALAEMD